MGKVEGKSWQGDKIYISFNKHKDLGAGNNSQDWSKPELVFQNQVIFYGTLPYNH